VSAHRRERTYGRLVDQLLKLDLSTAGPKPGIPRVVVVCWVAADRMATSFCSAAARVVSIAATSPNQPCSLASSSRSMRLAWILSSRGIWVGSTRSSGHRTQAFSCTQGVPWSRPHVPRATFRSSKFHCTKQADTPLPTPGDLPSIRRRRLGCDTRVDHGVPQCIGDPRHTLPHQLVTRDGLYRVVAQEASAPQLAHRVVVPRRDLWQREGGTPSGYATVVRASARGRRDRSRRPAVRSTRSIARMEFLLKLHTSTGVCARLVFDRS
jgi:hypothetical protein